MNALLPFFEWCDHTAIGEAIRCSVWAFPIIETFHIFALTLLFGTILVMDLRLLGAGLTRQPVSRVAANLWPWMMGSLAVILTTGTLLFLSEALKCFSNDGFRFKMVCLFFALLFHFTFFRRAAWHEGAGSPLGRKMTAVVSMLLWLGVGVGGRAIGFV